MDTAPFSWREELTRSPHVQFSTSLTRLICLPLWALETLAFATHALLALRLQYVSWQGWRMALWISLMSLVTAILQNPTVVSQRKELGFSSK